MNYYKTLVQNIRHKDREMYHQWGKNKKLLNWGHFKGAFLLFIAGVLITHELVVSISKHPFSLHSEAGKCRTWNIKVTI